MCGALCLVFPILVLAEEEPHRHSVEQKQVELFPYETVSGDSCAAIAKRYFGARWRYDMIHKYNDLGPLPHRHKQGSVLWLPKNENMQPSARVTYVKKQVDARSPVASDWQAAKPGLSLHRGWRVNTRSKASAELRFRDASRLQMRQNTLLIVYGGTQSEVRRKGQKAGLAVLEKGTLRNRLGELRLRVATPSTNTSFEGGDSVLAVRDSGATSVSVHSGAQATVRGKSKGGKVSVKPGFGTIARKGERPRAPRPLPPPPRWIHNTRRVLGTKAEGGTIWGSWATVPQAHAYRLEVSKHMDGSEPVFSTEMPPHIHSYRLSRLPIGTYYIRLVTVDYQHLESAPSDESGARVEVLSLQTSPAKETLRLMTSNFSENEARPFQIPLGGYLRAPSGFLCHPNLISARKEIRFSTKGLYRVYCRNEQKKESLPPVLVRVSDAS